MSRAATATAAEPAFGLELAPGLLDAVFAAAEAAYPREVCGVLVGPSGSARVDEVVRLENVALDPHRAFRFDAGEHLRLLLQLEARGRSQRVIFHSHCDAEAGMSPADRQAAAPGGVALWPGVLHLIVTVRAGARERAVLCRFDPEARAFEAVELTAA